jgi:hypothetical protein
VPHSKHCVTPEFARGLAAIERLAGWNAEQFRRRFAGRWVTLPRQSTEEDLEELAVRLLPKIGARGLKTAVAYARTGRDVSGLCYLADDARGQAAKEGRSEANFQDFKRALEFDRLPSDNALAAAFARSVSRRRQPADDPIGDMPAEPLQAPCEAVAERLPLTDSGILPLRAGAISDLLPA